MSRGLRAIAGIGMMVVAPFTGPFATGFLAAGASMTLGAAMEQKPPKMGGRAGQTVMVRSESPLPGVDHDAR